MIKWCMDIQTFVNFIQPSAGCFIFMMVPEKSKDLLKQNHTQQTTKQVTAVKQVLLLPTSLTVTIQHYKLKKQAKVQKENIGALQMAP